MSYDSCEVRSHIIYMCELVRGIESESESGSKSMKTSFETSNNTKIRETENWEQERRIIPGIMWPRLWGCWCSLIVLLMHCFWKSVPLWLVQVLLITYSLRPTKLIPFENSNFLRGHELYACILSKWALISISTPWIPPQKSYFKSFM